MMTTTSTTIRRNTTTHGRNTSRHKMMVMMITMIIAMVILVVVFLLSDIDIMKSLLLTSSNHLISNNETNQQQQQQQQNQYEYEQSNEEQDIGIIETSANEGKGQEGLEEVDVVGKGTAENENTNIINKKESLSLLSLPHFVLHVGPPKTATTTIQESMKQYDDDHILWNKGRYIYLGKYIETPFDRMREHSKKRHSYFITTTTSNNQDDDDNNNNNRRQLLHYNKYNRKKQRKKEEDDIESKLTSLLLSANTTTSLSKLYQMTDRIQKNIIQRTIRDRQCHDEMSIIREQYYYCIYQHNNNNTNKKVLPLPRYNGNKDNNSKNNYNNNIENNINNTNNNDHNDDGLRDDNNENTNNENRYQHNVNCTELLDSIYSDEEYKWFTKGETTTMNHSQFNHRNEFVLSISPYRFLHRELIRIPCAERIIRLLKSYSYYNINMIWSEELMSRGGERYTTLYTKYDTLVSNLDYISLSILLMPYYQLSIIVSYRRYYQWYPSAKQQQERYSRRRHHYNVWPSMPKNYNHSNDNNNNSNDNNHRDTLSNMGSNALNNPAKDYNSNSYNNNLTVSSTTSFLDDSNIHITNDDDVTMLNNHDVNYDTTMYEESGGLLMEPLFPHYWKRVIPGQIVLSDNQYLRDEEEEEEDTTDNSIGSKNLLQSNDNTTMINHHRSSSSSSSSLLLRNVPNDIYMAYTVGIPCHYTNFSYYSLLEQKRLISDYAIGISYISDHHTRKVGSTTTTNSNHRSNHHNDNDNHNIIKNQSSSSSLLNVILFNLHELLDINQYKTPLVRTLFICNAIPSSSKSNNQLCQYSKEYDIMNPNNELHYNPSIDYSTYDILVTAAYLTGKMKRELIHNGRHQTVLATQRYYEYIKEQYNNNEQNLTTNNTNNNEDNQMNQQQQTKNNHDNISNNNNNNNTNLYEFPLICPSHNELEEYLNYSLLYESTLLPHFYKSIYGKERHISDFWEDAMKRHKFCTIDTNSTLQQHYWQEFFFF